MMSASDASSEFRFRFLDAGSGSGDGVRLEAKVAFSEPSPHDGLDKRVVSAGASGRVRELRAETSGVA